jgi:hypothetical protein
MHDYWCVKVRLDMDIVDSTHLSDLPAKRSFFVNFIMYALVRLGGMNGKDSNHTTTGSYPPSGDSKCALNIVPK